MRGAQVTKGSPKRIARAAVLILLVAIVACGEAPIETGPTASPRPDLNLVTQSIVNRTRTFVNPADSGLVSLSIDEARGVVVLVVTGPDAPLLRLLPDFGDALVIEYGKPHVPL